MFEKKEKTPVFLAFFDILGTSRLLEKKQENRVYELYEYMTDLTTRLNERSCFSLRPGGDGYLYPCSFVQQIFSAHFSDTFIIWSNFHQAGFPPFLDTCMNVFCEALGNGIPLRGCVSVGEAIMNTATGQFVGEPLSESAKGETSQKWLGFSFGQSFFQAPCWDCKTYIPYTKHIKSTNSVAISQIAVDWPRYWREHKADMDLVEIINKMDDTPGFTDYYQNTLAFIKHSEQHTTWWDEMNMINIETPEQFKTSADLWLSAL